MFLQRGTNRKPLPWLQLPRPEKERERKKKHRHEKHRVYKKGNRETQEMRRKWRRTNEECKQENQFRKKRRNLQEWRWKGKTQILPITYTDWLKRIKWNIPLGHENTAGREGGGWDVDWEVWQQVQRKPGGREEQMKKRKGVAGDPKGSPNPYSTVYSVNKFILYLRYILHLP